jgi:hypothetical protein
MNPNGPSVATVYAENNAKSSDKRAGIFQRPAASSSGFRWLMYNKYPTNKKAAVGKSRSGVFMNLISLKIGVVAVSPKPFVVSITSQVIATARGFFPMLR